MNKEIIIYNLEIIRQYLGKNGQEFSKMFNKEQSYYRAHIKKGLTPNLKFIIDVCNYCHIKIDDFCNKKLELKLVFEDDYLLHSGQNFGDNNNE